MDNKKPSTGTVRFTLRTDKNRQSGQAPIEITYSLHGQRKRINSKLHIFPFLWDAENQKATYFSKKEAKEKFPSLDYKEFPFKSDIETFNANLINWNERIKNAENHLKGKGIKYTSTDVTKAIKEADEKNRETKKEEPKNYLADFINFHLDNTKATSNTGTQKIYKTLAKTIKEFEAIKRTRITLANADYSFMQSFYNFMVEHKKYVNPTSQKKISSIKIMLKIANVKYGYPINASYKNFTFKKDEMEVIALTQKEFDSLKTLDLSNNKKLDKVRDVFVFSCVTGLRYSDLENLKRENIKDGYLSIVVKKTRTLLTVTLTGTAYDVLAKYGQMSKPLPVISNQKMNSYLKELCQLAEINEPVEIVRYRGSTPEVNLYQKWELISAHTGRKTFVTLSLSKGMAAEEVMAVTGHKAYANFKRYVNITEDQKRKAMLDAWGEIQLKVAQ